MRLISATICSQDSCCFRSISFHSSSVSRKSSSPSLVSSLHCSCWNLLSSSYLSSWPRAIVTMKIKIATKHVAVIFLMTTPMMRRKLLPIWVLTLSGYIICLVKFGALSLFEEIESTAAKVDRKRSDLGIRSCRSASVATSYRSGSSGAREPGVQSNWAKGQATACLLVPQTALSPVCNNFPGFHAGANSL